MSALVYQAINAVAAELADGGIAKRHRNDEGGYDYRSMEDVLNALAPHLARHKLCVLPRVLERDARLVVGGRSQVVTVRAAFDFVSALDGSRHIVETFGEALDESDKGTSKAMSAAYKSAMLQAFCIPVPQEDTDATSPRLNGIALPEPPEGWDCWAGELIDIAKSCESADAIDRLCHTRRAGLSALQRARPELYDRIGAVIAAKIEAAHVRPERGHATSASPVKSGRPKRAREKSGASRSPAEAA